MASRIGSVRNEHEKAWRELIADPSKWWDNRLGKLSPRSPDFRHKRTGAGLWLENILTPSWVKSEIATLEKECPEKQWHDLFLDPSHWWDHRSRKRASSFPDFIKKQTGEALWLKQRTTPPWVPSKVITSLGPGTIQSDIISSVEKLSRYNKAGQFTKTLTLFCQMQLECISVDYYIFLDVLKACSALRILSEGRNIHRQIVETGCEQNPYISTALVDMYAKCGSLEDAWAVFRKMPTRTVVSWNAMIHGCVNCGQELEALGLFQQMQLQSFEPSSVTFVALLNACAKMAALEEGRRIHRHIIQHGCEWNSFVSSSLVDMYAKCGSLEDARTVFDKMPIRDVVSWSAMILGCVNCGQELEALRLFPQMELERVEPSSVTFVALLNACAKIAALEEGRRIHRHIIQHGCESNVYVSSSLVDMYAKCGSLHDARSVFDKMLTRTVVSWNAMILGCVSCGQELEALGLYEQMQLESVEPSSVTFLALLNACARMAALEEGRRIHRDIIQHGCESDAHVSNALLDMYAKCGELEDARTVFEKMSTRNVVSWTAMMMGFAMHGLAKEAATLFEEMSLSGSEINEVTFIGLLSACSHGGLVKEGLDYFECMSSVYGLTPTQEHYTIMVDILGRAGQLDDAEAMVLTMPLEPCAATWMSLLGSCRIHGNVQMGERVFQRIVERDPNNDAGYVLLSNIYAGAGNDESKYWLKNRLEKGLWEEPGRSWIEVNNNVHSFVVNDMQHPEILRIRKELTRLSVHMKKAGYVPHSKFALHDSEEGKMVTQLCPHSEKLAIAFGLINTIDGAPLKIVKNSRVCVDCHTAIKFIVKITRRSIILRDANLFHHFKDGKCSCGDCWLLDSVYNKKC